MNTTQNATAHTPWCDSALCSVDTATGSTIHITAPLTIETSAGPAQLSVTDAGDGPEIMLAISDEGLTPEDARRLSTALADLADHVSV